MKAENSILHVYLMPGMAANPSIFEYIKLPVDVFEVHLLSWKIPLQEETLSDYALRMLEEVHHENFDFSWCFLWWCCGTRDGKA